MVYLRFLHLRRDKKGRGKDHPIRLHLGLKSYRRKPTTETLTDRHYGTC